MNNSNMTLMILALMELNCRNVFLLACMLALTLGSVSALFIHANLNYFCLNYVEKMFRIF